MRNSSPGSQPGLREARGAVPWAVIDTSVGRAASFAAQLVFGRYLLPAELGYYAIALSVSAFGRVFQDAGTRDLVITASEDELEPTLSSAAWIALTTNVVLATCLLLLSYPISLAYGSEQVALFIGLIGINMVVASGWSISSALLQRRSDYQDYYRINVSAAIVQFGGAALLVALGMGPAGILIAAIAASGVRGLAGRFVSGTRLLTADRPTKEQFRSVLSQSKWLIIASFGMSVVAQGDYFILGFMLSASSLGYYYFAYQLANQGFPIVVGNVQTLLFPVFARSRRNGRDIGQMFYVTAFTLVTLGMSVGLALIAAFWTLNNSIWDSRWTDSSISLTAFCLGMPLFFLYTLTRMILLASLLNRLWAFCAISMGAVVVVASLVSGLSFGTADAVAITMAASLAVVGWTYGLAIARNEGFSVSRYSRVTLVPWLSGMILAPGWISFWQQGATVEFFQVGWSALLACAVLMSAGIACRHELRSLMSLVPSRRHRGAAG